VEEQGVSGSVWAPPSATEMAAALSTRRWLRRDDPFPHLIANDVFTPRVYAALEAQFLTRLHPPGARPDVSGFTRSIRGYDVTAFLFHPRLDGPLRLFVSRGFRDLVAGATGVEVTHHVSGGLHHHAVGSATGSIHTDLNPAWFVEYSSPDGMVVVDHTAVRYVTGEPRRPGARAKPYVRAVAILFYLANPPWRPGDGGETALYDSPDCDLMRPAVRVPPINNSLVAFEVTPQSFHAFLTNRRRPRNCVAMWLHRRRAEVVEQWGEGVIENDPTSRSESLRPAVS
jgi:hypothetical protein